MNLADLQNWFPKSRKNAAITGNIPFAYFVANEKEIRAMMREEKLRLFYRGPRNQRIFVNIYGVGYYTCPTMTRREDAKSVLLYRR